MALFTPQKHNHTTPTPTTLAREHLPWQPCLLTTKTQSHYTNTNHISQRTPAPTALFTPQKHNHTTPTPTTLAREHLPWWPCTRTTVSQKPDRLHQQKSETRMTANVLKQDPNTKRFKRILVYFDTDTRGNPPLSSHKTTLKQQISG